jgi:GNAT superfamily N-acetyltransferase
VEITVRSFVQADVDDLAAVFADWPKDRELFERYAALAAAGAKDVVVATADAAVVGYLTIDWTSHYPAFAAAGIPEIADFNVIASARRNGIGGRLMDEAERRIAQRSPIAGIGVGMYADYGSAQRMYVKRGYVPDGAGLVVDGIAPAPGSTIVLDDSPALMFTKLVGR